MRRLCDSQVLYIEGHENSRRKIKNYLCKVTADRQNPHGFRHIASTALNNQFSDKAQVVEASLAHMKKGSKGSYDKATHLEERVGMMQWWADYIDNLVKE